MLMPTEFEEVIRSKAAEMEEAGVVHEEALQLIYDHRLFKLFVPDEFGGRMTGLPEALRLFEEASRWNGSFGWAVTIGSGGGYFVPCFPQEIAKPLFSDPKAVIAGSGMPSGRARRTQGGYLVSGEWKFCSGSPYATLYTATVTAEEEDNANSIFAVALQPDQVTIVPDWNAFGLRATASHSIRVDNAFVPDRHVFQVMERSHRSEPIYGYPFVPFAITSFTAVCLGISSHLLEEAERMLEQHKERWGEERSSGVGRRLEQARKQWELHRAAFYRVVEASWQRHLAGDEGEAGIAEVSRVSKRATRAALSCGSAVFPYLGMDAVMHGSPVNRIWRDLQTACQHSAIVPFADQDLICDFET